MKVIIDAYGGDNAPLEIVKGAAQAVAEYGVEAVLCGSEAELRELCEKSGISTDGFVFVEAEGSMPVEADPALILRDYSGSSMAVGLELLSKGEGDAFVSAGSTAALVVGASLVVKRMKGVKRAALGTVIPSVNGCYMLLDVGANAECRPEMLAQFGVMGSVYMEKTQGLARPRVGIINIGAEENKGLGLQIDAARLMKDAPIRFIGNVEARDLPLGGCDVAVADGFVGNIVLKLTEGMGKLINIELKNILTRSAATKMAAAVLKGGVMDFRARMDYTEYGGAPLLGISRPVIKAHGSSNAKAVKNAIRQAKQVFDNDVTGIIRSSLEDLPKGE